MPDPSSEDHTSDDTIRIFISSPGDVAQERVIAERVVERLQGEFARRAELDVIRWEREPLRATEHFQEQITPPAETDIALFILWSRLGTPLPEEKFQKESGEQYKSGTEWEFENAVEGYREEGTPDLVTYRKTKDPEATLSDEEDLQQRLEQKEALEAFIDRWFRGEEGESFRAAFHTFEEPADFERMLEEHLRKLIEKHLPVRPTESGRAGPTVQSKWHQGSPFRGLRPFEEEHAPIFFGRTEAVTRILQRLEEQAGAGHPFVLVHGPSGSGKSSVVRAGVVPTITRPGVIEGVGLWRRAYLRPSSVQEGLVEGLAATLFRAVPELEETGFDVDGLTELLGETPGQVAALLQAGLQNAAEAETEESGLPEPPEKRVLLAVDQLEEIFTMEGADRQERAAFAAALRGLVESGLVWTVATLRSDFFPRLSEVEDLRDLKQGDGNYDLDPPSFAELGLAIRGPVRAAGLRFERDPDRGIGLDEVLHEAAAEAPEALPLLEFTLEELYRRRTEDDVLTFEAYEELGGLKGAIAERAESVFKDLAPGVQAAFGDVMGELVTIEPGGEEGATSRRARQSNITDTTEKEAFTDALVEARLLVTGQTDDGTAVVNVAHEALLREWPRLKEWIERNRAFLQTRTRVQGRAARWDGEGRPDDLLLPTGQPLAEARGLLEEREEALNDTLRTYVERSIERAEKRERRRRRIIGGVAVAFFLIVSGFGLFSFQQWTTAAEQRNQLLYQKSEDLAAQARAEVDSGRAMTGMLLALEALPENMSNPDRPYVPKAQSALYHALMHKQEEAFFRSSEAQINRAVLGPEGRYVAAATNDGTIRLYDLDRRKVIAVLQRPAGGISSFRFDSTASRLAMTGNGPVHVWAVPSGKLIEKRSDISLLSQLNGFGSTTDLTNLNFHANESSGIVSVVKVQGGQTVHEFDSQLENFILTEVRPQVDRVVAVGESGVQSWSLKSRPSLSELGSSTLDLPWTDDIATHRRGQRVAWVDKQGRPHLSSLNGGLSDRTLPGHDSTVVELAFGRDGNRLVTAGLGGVVQIWNVTTGDRLARLRHQHPARWVGLTDGNQVVTQIDTVQDRRYGREYLSSVVFWDTEAEKRTATIDSVQRLRGSVKNKDAHPKVLPGKEKVVLVRDPVLTEEEKDTQLADSDSVLVQVHSAETGKRLMRFGERRRVSQLGRVAPNGKYVLVEGDSSGYILELEEGKYAATVDASSVQRPTFGPEGRWLAYEDSEANALLYDVERKRLVDTLRPPSGSTSSDWSFEFGPNSRRAISTAYEMLPEGGGYKFTQYIWKITDPGVELMADLSKRSERAELRNAQFSPNGKYVFTSGRDDPRIRFYRATVGTREDMEEVFYLQHYQDVGVEGFIPDGSHVITQTEDGTLRAWPVFGSPQALIDTARAEATRQLTDPQREQFNLVTEE